MVPLLSRPPVPNYIEFTRSQKVEFANKEGPGMNASDHAGVELGENGSMGPRPRAKR